MFVVLHLKAAQPRDISKPGCLTPALKESSLSMLFELTTNCLRLSFLRLGGRQWKISKSGQKWRKSLGDNNQKNFV